MHRRTVSKTGAFSILTWTIDNEKSANIYLIMFISLNN